MLHITLCHLLHPCCHWLSRLLSLLSRATPVTSHLSLSVRLHLKSSIVSHFVHNIDVKTLCHNCIMKGHTAFLDGSVSQLCLSRGPSSTHRAACIVFILDDGWNRLSGSSSGGSPSGKLFSPPLPPPNKCTHTPTNPGPSRLCFRTVASYSTTRLSTFSPKTCLTVEVSPFYPQGMTHSRCLMAEGSSALEALSIFRAAA